MLRSSSIRMLSPVVVPERMRVAGVCAALLVALACDAFAQPQRRPGDATRSTAPKSVESKPGDAKAAPSSPDRIALNFKDAEIESVVAAFGHLLDRTFLVDPRVKGKITLETPKNVSRPKAYELLQASLRAQGFAIVEGNGFSRVVPEADAKLQSGPVRVGPQGDRDGDEVVTQIFRLNYESASNLVPVLRPLIAPNNTVTAYPSNNSLVITDYAANLKRLAGIIAGLDSPSTSEVELVTVKHALAADVALTLTRMIDDAARAGQGAQIDPGQRVLVLPDPRTNSVMLRTASAAKMNLAKSLLARLDRPSDQPGNIHVVYLRNAEAIRLAQVLRGVLTGDAAGAAGQSATIGGTNNPTGFSQSPQGAAGAPGTAGGLGAQGAMGTNTQTGGTFGSSTPGQPATGAGQSTTFQAGGAIIAADQATNSLIITAPEPIYRNLRAVIERLDARRAQVFIESLIVEISADTAAELGVQWQFMNGLTSQTSSVIGGTNLPARSSGASSNILDLAVNPLAANQGLNLGVVKGAISVGGQTIFNLGLLARALETGANGNILATPNLLTLDNEEARIVIGRNLPFTTGQFTSTGTTTGTVNPFQTIERRDVGTMLRVRPQVSESGSVRMQIFQETSSVESISLQGPITTRRAIESNVLVDDGQIVVLGGLIEDKVEGSVQKVPGLGDVPMVGQLFRYDARKRTKTNLLVFLRPVVLRDANAAHTLTGERYEFMRQMRADSRLPQHWALPDYVPPELPGMPAAPAAPAASPKNGDAPAAAPDASSR